MTPMKIRRDNWRSRWMVTPRWAVLHRVARIEWMDDDHKWIAGRGMTVCGLESELRRPGLFSRMGLKRCASCCRELGIPQGKGAPFNDESLTKKQAAA